MKKQMILSLFIGCLLFSPVFAQEFDGAFGKANLKENYSEDYMTLVLKQDQVSQLKPGSERIDESTSLSAAYAQQTNQTTVSHFSAPPKRTSYTWGIGLRLGDPTGLSVKRFLGNRSWEFNFGRTAYWSYNPEWAFNRYDDFNDYDYLDSRLRSAISFQAHYLFFKDIPDFEGLQWYYGFGGQLRALSANYYYRYRVYYGPGAGDYRWERRWEKITNLDFGIDGVIGLDYTFPKAPVSIFTDITLFGEIVDHPFRFHVQGGAGVRYNF